MKPTKYTPRAIRRMKLVLKRRRDGKTFVEISRELKVTRERIRQIEHLAIFFEKRGIL